MSEILEILSNFAFPVAVCACFFFVWREEISNHKAEVSALADQLHANTLVLQKLVDRLERIEKE